MARTRRITAENLTPAGLSSWNGCEAGFKRSGASFSPVLPFPPVMAASRKLIGLFLGVSLAGNAALLGYVSLHHGGHAAARLAAASGAESASAIALRDKKAADAAETATGAWAAIASDDLGTYAANLRATGLPDRLVRAIINAEINERFKARENALKPARASDNYWESSDYYDRNSGDTLEKRMARIDLRREKDALRRSLLGDEPPAPGDTNPIPPGKRDAVRKISEDYDAMIQQVEMESRGFPLAADREKLAYLRAEKDKELRGILSPEEYEANQLRSSQGAQQLRWDLAAFKPNEAEFALIYQLRQNNPELSKNPDNSYSPEDWARRNAAEQKLTDDLRQQLGEERYQDYIRSRDYGYRQLAQLGTRLGLPAATINEVYDQRRIVPEAALAIAKDPQRDRAAKEAALKQLAETARQDIYARLGQEAGELYIKNGNNNQWLNALERGTIIVQTGDNSWSHHTLDEFSPRPAPAK